MTEIIDQSISKNNKTFKDLTLVAKQIIDGKTEPLVRELYKHGYSTQKVANVMGLSKKEVARKYPKGKNQLKAGGNRNAE